ncbi:MAG TPA: hypothetical protein DCZ40_08500 [Lachnospiraceae bacterium]|nr:hypothetical protein [Lachnospiraceae bacterium]
MENRYENDEEGNKFSSENHISSNENREDESTQGAECGSRRPRRFGRGIYDKTDVPIRLLDGFIAGIIIIIVAMVIVFAFFGGYTVSFDTSGGTEIASQKLRYGNLVEMPKEPVRQGYTFEGWYYEGHEDETWDFSVGKVGGDLTLIARWEPAKVTVKFDAGGGTLPDGIEYMEVTYQEAYGELPVPEKEGSRFAGWIYSGEEITPESIVTMPGEHVLTALWE